MPIEVNEVRDLADWAISKACNGWRTEKICYDQETGAPRPEPHHGCIQAQRAHDLLSKVERYEGQEVVGWLVEDAQLDPEIWQ